MATKKVKVLPQQTIYDIAIQEYGSVEAVFSLIEDNPNLDLEKELVVDSLLIIDSEKVKDQNVVDYLAKRKEKPAHGGGNDPFTSAFSDGYNQETVN